MLKLAKEMASKELESYNEEKREEYNQKVTDLNSNEHLIEDITNKSEKDIEEIKNGYNSRKDNVINFLFI